MDIWWRSMYIHRHTWFRVSNEIKNSLGSMLNSDVGNYSTNFNGLNFPEVVEVLQVSSDRLIRSSVCLNDSARTMKRSNWISDN